MTSAALDQYRQLSALLVQDPDNLSLIGDTAEAAYAAARYDEAEALLAGPGPLAALSPALRNLAGLIAMARRDWPLAVERFEDVRGAGDDAPAVRFNLAWSLTMAKRPDEALPLLDDEVVESIPQAAQLLVGLLHQRGELDGAAARGRALLVRFPTHRGLNAAMSTLATDIGDVALARETAVRAGDHPEALVTLATLALGEDRPEEAGRLYDAALAAAPAAPRAWIGRGLVALAADDRGRACESLDRGAELFGTHLGSWIAAGWAHVLAGDLAAAQQRFETALAIDDRFAEAQGSLAVVSLARGDLTDARRRAETALRLDRASFAGSLAAALLASGSGDAAKAQRIVALALEAPVDGTGRTIGQALARLATRH